MSWKSGSGLAQDLWDDIKDILTPEQRILIRKAIIKNFKDQDCDTTDTVEW